MYCKLGLRYVAVVVSVPLTCAIYMVVFFFTDSNLTSHLRGVLGEFYLIKLSTGLQ